MADNTVDIKVKINAETGQLDVLGAKFKGAAAGAKEAEGAFTGLSGEARNLLSSLGLVATAGGIVAFFHSAIKGAEEQNEAWRRLKFTVESTGQSFAAARGQAEGWVNAIAQGTRFSDSQAIATLEKLTRVTGSLTQAQKASELAMGLSKASGQELSSTVSLVTNLLNGNERALIEVKREFGNVAGSATDTQTALDRLSDTYGKVAFQNEGLTDASARLGNAFNQFKDTVGNALTGPLTTLLGWATKAVSNLDQVGLVFASMAAKVVVGIETLGAAWAKAMVFDFSGASASLEDFHVRIKSINEETESQFIASENRKTAAVAASTHERLVVTAAAHLKELKDQADANAKYKKLMEERIKGDIIRIHQKADQDKSDNRRAVDDTLQTFALLNELGNAHTQGELNRGRVILAMEKAVAIGRIWADEGTIPMKIAGTALVVAQFAQQSQAMGDAQRAFESGQSSTSVTTPIGDGTGRDVTVGAGTGGRAGAGGGTGGTVINQSFVFNLAFDSLDPGSVEKVAEAIATNVRKNMPAAANLSRTLAASAARNSGVAS